MEKNMSNFYTWTVTGMSAYPEYQGEADVVFDVQWTCQGSNGATPPVTSVIGNFTQVPLNSGSSFTPYVDLTQDQVIGWVQSAMGAEQVAALYAALDTLIEQTINPPVVNPPLPWVPQPTPPAA
jgi:hypothetical protein